MAALKRLPSTPSVAGFRRIVVKVGSSLLVDREKSAVRRQWLEALVDDLAVLHNGGADLLVVSSGAIALGRTVLRLPGNDLKLDEAQAAEPLARSP